MIMMLISALLVGVLHALAPDHWIPFTTIGASEKWSGKKLNLIVFLAGLMHLLSAFVLGLLAIRLGVSLARLTRIESWRADIFSYLLMGFGIATILWGLKYHTEQKLSSTYGRESRLFWTYFTLFVFGPCEPLIPVMFAAALKGWQSLLLSSILFSIGTLTTMLVTVNVLTRAFTSEKLFLIRRWSPISTGAAIALTGVVVRILGI